MIALTIVLIIVTTFISIMAFSRRDIQYKWIFNPYQVHTHKEYWRFISSGFVHADYSHLILNMVALYFFGKTVEYHLTDNFELLGKFYFILLYLGGIVVSDIPSFLKHRDNPGFNSLGASGGVAAVLFGSILYRPTAPLSLMFIPIAIPAFILGALYLIYSYYSGKKMVDNINHDAHLYGALFGLFFTIILNPPVVIGFVNQIKDFSLF